MATSARRRPPTSVQFSGERSTHVSDDAHGIRSTDASRAERGDRRPGGREEQRLDVQAVKERPPHGAGGGTAAGGRELADDGSTDDVGDDDHAPAREETNPEPLGLHAPLGRAPQRPGRNHQRERGEHPREDVESMHDADEVTHESARVQAQHGHDALAVEPTRGLGARPGRGPPRAGRRRRRR